MPCESTAGRKQLQNPADSLPVAARELLQEQLTQAFEWRIARLAVLNPSSQG